MRDQGRLVQREKRRGGCVGRGVGWGVGRRGCRVERRVPERARLCVLPSVERSQ